MGLPDHPNPPIPFICCRLLTIISWLPTTKEVLVTSMPWSLMERETPSHRV